MMPCCWNPLPSRPAAPRSLPPDSLTQLGWRRVQKSLMLPPGGSKKDNKFWLIMKYLAEIATPNPNSFVTCTYYTPVGLNRSRVTFLLAVCSLAHLLSLISLSLFLSLYNNKNGHILRKNRCQLVLLSPSYHAIVSYRVLY